MKLRSGIAHVLVCFCVLAGAPFATPASAQASGNTARVPTVTRLVKQFFEVESDLNAKLAARDRVGVEQLLDADFEMRRSAVPASPVPRADWIRSALGAASKLRIEQMAVHDFGTVMVVSFRQFEVPMSAKAQTSRLIVDCWARSGDRWMLAVRYEGATDAAVASDRRVRATGR